MVLINTKGGAGKSTVALNLAARLAQDGRGVVLVDGDPQESSARCLARREKSFPPIQFLSARGVDFRITRLYRLVDEKTTEVTVFDTPGAVPDEMLMYFCRDAHKVIIPVQPSQIDIDACARLVGKLYGRGGIRANDRRLGVVANRIRPDSVSFERLLRFLTVLQIPLVASLRDLQTYQRCLERGIGITETDTLIPPSEIDAWDRIMHWLYDKNEPSTVETPTDHTEHP